MHITAAHSGKCVAFNSSPDAPVVRILGVFRDSFNPSISYESSDGHSEGITSNMWRTLDEQTANWRPATDEETQKFLARYTPPPQNWY